MNCKIIAHRGESFDAPENTISSVNLAWERNADAVEIDIHLTLDKRIVVIHDPNTKRTGGKNSKVKNQTLEELKKIDVGSWKDAKYKDEKIPTLLEVLNTVPPDKSLVIEIKSGKKLLPFLKMDIGKSHVSKSQIEIISFNYDTVRAAKKIFPDVNILYIENLDYSWITKIRSPSVGNLIKKVQVAGLDGLNVWAGKLLKEDFAKRVKDAGLILYTWTVNNPEHAQQLVSWGIDGITTDRAGWMKNQII
jgi:glycerophosphoryl diester phosphodiesterase